MTKHLFGRVSSVALTAIIFAATILAATQAGAATCASLARLALDDTNQRFPQTSTGYAQ